MAGASERGEDMSGVSGRKGGEDVTHWLLECNAWCTKRQPLLQAMRHIANDFDNLCEDDKLVIVLDKGCQHLICQYSKSIMKMWTAWF